MTSRPVLQQPSRTNPVIGFNEQTSSRSPRTFRGALGRPPPFPLFSLNIAVSRIVAMPPNAGRRIALHDTQFADAAVATIRLKLLKLGARVCISARRVHFAVASSCPNQHEFEAAYLALKRTFSSA
jgi:hypothetical protein